MGLMGHIGLAGQIGHMIFINFLLFSAILDKMNSVFVHNYYPNQC
jgi:hypothetical protein